MTITIHAAQTDIYAAAETSYQLVISHKYSDTYKADDETHWKECACGEKTDVNNHADGNKDHKCDVCGKILSKCADTNKDHKCDLCGKTLSEHTGGTATCKDKAKCAVCGESYGELDANNHTDLKQKRQPRLLKAISNTGIAKDAANITRMPKQHRKSPRSTL